MLWRGVNLDALVQHVEHDVPACAVQHMSLSAGHKDCCLVQFFLLVFNQICCRFVSNIWFIGLTAGEDQIKFKWRFEFEFEFEFECNKSYILESLVEQSIPTRLEIHKEKDHKTFLYKETLFSYFKGEFYTQD